MTFQVQSGRCCLKLLQNIIYLFMYLWKCGREIDHVYLWGLNKQSKVAFVLNIKMRHFPLGFSARYSLILLTLWLLWTYQSKFKVVIFKPVLIGQSVEAENVMGFGPAILRQKLKLALCTSTCIRYYVIFHTFNLPLSVLRSCPWNMLQVQYIAQPENQFGTCYVLLSTWAFPYTSAYMSTLTIMLIEIFPPL